MVNNEQMGALLTGHSRQPVPSPSSYVVIGLLFFCPCISCPLLHNFVGYELTILWSLVKLPFWAWRSGKINWWTPYPEMHLLLRTHVVHLLALFLTKASLRLPCVFPFYIYSAHSSFFPYFIFADYWERQRERPSLVTSSFLASVNISSVTSHSVNIQTFLQSIF